MSDRTLKVMESVLRRQRPEALWIDAFCIPHDEPDRSECLNRIGAIYSHATCVIAVLSKQCFETFRQVGESGRMEESSLAILEKDDWVSRVWTYQELVNNPRVHFVSESGGDEVDAEELLNRMGQAIQEFQAEHGCDGFEFRSWYPKVDSLEDVIVDWKISGYLERTAYQVMSCMHGREATHWKDRFFAMIGAIGSSSGIEARDAVADPMEHFMRICEEKGDFSFIYSLTARSSEFGKGWRPVVGDRLEPMFAWHSFGDGQSGVIYPNHLELNGMWCLETGSTAPVAKEFIVKWLNDDSLGSESDISVVVLARLRAAGFAGCGDFLETEGGYMFLDTPIEHKDTALVAVATGVRMVHGCPGLILRRTESDIYSCSGVGLFVGQVPTIGERIKVG